jgi:valyl-tRNA synthetase
LPFVTEEVWSWWQDGSVHRAPWPTVAEVGPHAGAEPGVLDVAAEVLSAVRRQKTAHKRSMRARVTTLTVTAPRRLLLDVEAARGDLVDACGVDDFVTQEEEDEEAALTVDVELAED